MGATAGDLLARDVACEWLVEAGHEVDVAVARPFSDGVDWRTVDPEGYSHVVFVCGPVGNGPPLTALLDRFAGRPFVGLDVTMLHELADWNPFELLLERDSGRAARPDISFLSTRPLVPVVGLVVIDVQPEYGAGDAAARASTRLEALAARRGFAVVRIDTRLDENATGLSSAEQVESVIARMDVVLTTRLHGLVLALKNGVPVVGIDPVEGGAKVTRQAEAVGWPHVFSVDSADEQLERALAYCLSARARADSQECAVRAREALGEVRSTFISTLSGS
jgi:Polysaccharide pyruvyl transferase